MNSLIETAIVYCVTLTELFQKLLATVVNYGLNVFGLSSSTISEFTDYMFKTNDEGGMNFTEFYKQLIDLLSFDPFQTILLKIFLLILFSLLIMNYAAWYVYGSPISDRFVYSELIRKDERSDTQNR